MNTNPVKRLRGHDWSQNATTLAERDEVEIAANHGAFDKVNLTIYGSDRGQEFDWEYLTYAMTKEQARHLGMQLLESSC